MSNNFYQHIAREVFQYSWDRVYKMKNQYNPTAGIYFQTIDHLILYVLKRLPNTIYCPQEESNPVIFLDPNADFSLDDLIASCPFQKNIENEDFCIVLQNGRMKIVGFDEDEYYDDYDYEGDECKFLTKLCVTLNENHPLLKSYHDFKKECLNPLTSPWSEQNRRITIHVDLSGLEIKICLSNRVTLIYNTEEKQLYYKSSRGMKTSLDISLFRWILCRNFNHDYRVEQQVLNLKMEFFCLDTWAHEFTGNFKRSVLEKATNGCSLPIFLICLSTFSDLVRKIPLIATKIFQTKEQIYNQLNEIYCNFIQLLPGGSTKGLKEDGIDQLKKI